MLIRSNSGEGRVLATWTLIESYIIVCLASKLVRKMEKNLKKESKIIDSLLSETSKKEIVHEWRGHRLNSGSLSRKK